MILRKIWVLIFIISVCALAGIWVSGIWVGGCASTEIAAPATTTTTSTSASTSTSTSTSSATTIPTGNYSVSGEVKFAMTSDAVKGGVAIAISGPIILNVVTDSNTGNYTANGLPGGSYTITASKMGWISSVESIVLSADLSKDFRLFPANWEVVNYNSSGGVLDSITPAGPVKRFAAGGDLAGNAIYLGSYDTGESWAPSVSVPTNEPLVQTSVIVINVRRAVDRLSRIWHTTDDGISWTYQATLTSEPIAAVTFNGIYSFRMTWEVVTESGKVLQTLNSGESYTDITPSGTGVPLDIMGFIPNLIYVVGTNGLAKRWNGVSWSSIGDLETVAAGKDLTAIIINGNYCAACSSDGLIFISTNGSSTWTEEIGGIPYPLRAAITMGSDTFKNALVSGGNQLIMRHY